MGVRTGLLPQQGGQKWVSPSLWGGTDPWESWKPLFDPINRGETIVFLPWARDLLWSLSFRPKKSLINVWRGTFLAIFSTKPIFDPEDDQFKSWKQTFSESMQKTGLMTWGSEQASNHSKGSKKGFFLLGGCGWPPRKSKITFGPSKPVGSLIFLPCKRALSSLNFNPQKKL